MRARRFALLFALLASFGSVAEAQQWCADRPGKATPACVVDPGMLQIETSLVDWSRTDEGASREDDLLFGDTLVKYGLSDAVELHAGFTSYEHDRTRTGTVIDSAGGFGDVTLGGRWRAIDGQDAHPSLAIQPSITLPTSAAGIGQSTWSTQLVVPIDVPIDDHWSANLSPFAAAAANDSGAGRHAAYGGTVDASYAVSTAVSVGGELWAQRDDDPSGHRTQASADLFAAWQPGSHWQLDAAAYAGLTAATPDIELVFGVTRRF
jgi:hypothetical protein